MRYWIDNLFKIYDYGEETENIFEDRLLYGNTFLFGDHGYGTKSFASNMDREGEIDYYYEDGDPDAFDDLIADPDLFFNDFERHHLEDELWGDDDVIINAPGTSDYFEFIWAGDGDDKVTAGGGWGESYIHGGDGNDDITLGYLNLTGPRVRGGRGNDVVRAPTLAE